MEQFRSIWWIKRDFRLYDNTALFQAIKQSQYVLPVYVIEPSLIESLETSPLHLHAQYTALSALRESLRKIGADVCIKHGEIIEVLAKIQKQYLFSSIYSHQETGSDLTYQRDKQVAQWCHSTRVNWIEYPQNAVQRGVKIERLNKNLWNTFMNSKMSPTISAMSWNTSLATLCTDEVPNVAKKINHLVIQPVTDTAAQRVLKSFLDTRGRSYWGSISSPTTAWFHGSRLSPHLAWGTISLRQVFQATQNRIQSVSSASHSQWTYSLKAFTSRLYWHDHFMQKLESYPDLEFHPADPKYAGVMYKDDDVSLYVWLQGRTGFPMVDATMRCLAKTGFVNFRMRAMVISFAAFGLHLSWRKILYPFARLMLDYEPGIHIYQVQMQSGVTKGKSMRVYNPIKQMIEKDKESLFIKKWIPELSTFSTTEIYRYLLTAERFGVRKKYTLGDYSPPFINFARKSQEMKDRLAACNKKSLIPSTYQLGMSF